MDVLINLFVNGISTGMLIFLLASGLSLIFGLMSVLNFAHGGLFAWGAFTGVWLFNMTGELCVSFNWSNSYGNVPWIYFRKIPY